MDWIDVEGVVLTVLIIIELILFVRASIDLFKNTWWDDDTDGL